MSPDRRSMIVLGVLSVLLVPVFSACTGGGSGLGEPRVVDSDGDGAPDEQDACPDDPDKTSPGLCGCGVAETQGCGEQDAATWNQKHLDMGPAGCDLHSLAYDSACGGLRTTSFSAPEEHMWVSRLTRQTFTLMSLSRLCSPTNWCARSRANCCRSSRSSGTWARWWRRCTGDSAQASRHPLASENDPLTSADGQLLKPNRRFQGGNGGFCVTEDGFRCRNHPRRQ